jgi:arsenate reductase
MKFSFPSRNQKNEEQQQEKTILFVCIENAGRSQMAEGFFNQRYAQKGYHAISAGTRPVSQINPLAVQAMSEVGIDISGQKKVREIRDEIDRRVKEIAESLQRQNSS